MSIAGALAKAGYRAADAERLISLVCRSAGDADEIRDRVQAVRDTYRNAAEGKPILAWAELKSKLPPDTFSYVCKLLGSEQEDEEDAYAVPFKLTVRRNFPRSPALIESLLPCDPRGVVGYLAGLSQSFKSYLSLDWCCHISEGLDWHGFATAQAQTLYVAAEGQYSDIISRLRAWEAHHKRRVENLYCRLSPVRLDSESSVGFFLQRLLKMPNFCPKFIVFDTLSQCAGGTDENGSTDARKVYASCKLFGTQFGATVMIVHHAGKGDHSIMRGSSALFDDSDFVHQLVRPNWMNAGMDATFNTVKIKNAKPVKNMELQAIPVPWFDGQEKGEDLVLIQRVIESKFKQWNLPRTEE